MNVIQLFKPSADTAQVDCSRCKRGNIGGLDAPICNRPDCPMIDFGLQSEEDHELENEVVELWKAANRLKTRPGLKGHKLLILEVISVLKVALK
jgi:hypothetical protein